MDDVENFADYPLSIAEIKSDKTQLAGDWTPRDALIAALRDIDSGECDSTYAIIILGKCGEDNITHTRFYNATPNRYIMHGLIEDHVRRLTSRDATGEY